MVLYIPEEIIVNIWKAYFKEHVISNFMKQVDKKDTYEIALNKRTGLKSIYLKLDTEVTVSSIFQVCCDYGEINYYNWDEYTPYVNLPDCKKSKYYMHNSRY